MKWMNCSMDRPADYPKLKKYVPSRFMLPSSHYDESKADRAVRFIEMLPHTKGEWEGKPFWLLPWQEQCIRDIFGIVKEDGMRQFRTAFIEIPKKQGKQLSIDTPIPTPSGFTSMGDLKVGDCVFDERGKICHIVNKSEVDTEETAYRIVWEDGSEIIAGARHQWLIDRHGGIVTTEEIAGLKEEVSISIGGLKTHLMKSSPSHCYLAGKSMIPTHNSELAAAITLYLLFADNEPAAEVFSAAADRQQAGIVYDVAKRMVEMTPALLRRSKIMAATKRIVNYANAGYYQVVSADVANKHGYSISGLCFDELHVQPSRKLWDILTKGSGDARRQALHVAITTAGTDKNSICYELHCKAEDILAGRKIDHTFYPVVYSLPDDADWTDEKNWYNVNPSLGYTVPIERMRDAFMEAQENPAEENLFRQLRLCQWVGSAVAWIPEHVYDKGNQVIDENALRGRECYAGLDLSSTSDITALVLVFPPVNGGDKYIAIPHFWLPRDTLELRVRRDKVPYDVWEKQGLFHVTEGNVVDYSFVRKSINELNMQYNIKEIGVDRWNASQLITDLQGDGFTTVPIGMNFKDMSPGMKELYKLLLEGKMIHGGNPVLKWMAGNVVADVDAADNIKPNKQKSTEKIDGIVAWIMALDRAIRHTGETASVYDSRGLLVF